MEEENVNNESNPSLGSLSPRRRHIENIANPLNKKKYRFILHIRIFLLIMKSMRKAEMN